MKEKLFFIFFLSIVLTPNAQEDLASADFIGPKENIHLHLNKTTFLQGEHLWFKAYVMDQTTKRPSLSTTNLHVGIYGKDGKEVKRKLFYVESGMAQGDFAIDSTLIDSEYTVLAWTNYMRNFKDLEPFRQRIGVLKDGAEEKTGEVNMKISVYPEGGQLIAGAYNNFGILVVNGLGQGVKVNDLELVDDSGNVVRSNITTNDFGMGKSGFTVQANERYHLQRRLPNGSYVKQMLPNAVEDQLGLTVDNNGGDKVLLKLLASKATFDENDGAVHTVALYQDDFIRLEDFEVNADEQVLSIARNELPYGVLTAVLFDTELRPMAHRMFFNHKTDVNILQNVEVDHCLTSFGDSIQVDLILPKGVEGEMNLSISALPGQSTAYAPDNSIASSILVRPYIKQHYQDHYFFEGQDRKKRYELDKRLLIEGWGKYDWDSRKQKELELTFEMETGIPFQGKVIDANLDEERQISLVAQLSAEIGFEELQDNKSFKGSMVLFEGDSIEISLIGKKGKLRKPQAEIRFMDDLQLIHSIINQKMHTSVLKRQLDDVKNDIVDFSLNADKRTIALKEVVVTEQIFQDNKFQISADVEGRIIGPLEMKKYKTVAMYLRRLGFGVKFTGNDFYVQSFRYPYPVIPTYVIGRTASSGQIMNLTLNKVSSITFRKLGKYAFIAIALRDKVYLDSERRNKYIKFAVENGYIRPQEYFTPNYPDYDSAIFKNYGALDWRPNIIVATDIPTSITIPVQNQSSIQLKIEGIGADGKLLVLQKRMDVN